MRLNTNSRIYLLVTHRLCSGRISFLLLHGAIESNATSSAWESIHILEKCWSCVTHTHCAVFDFTHTISFQQTHSWTVPKTVHFPHWHQFKSSILFSNSSCMGKATSTPSWTWITALTPTPMLFTIGSKAYGSTKFMIQNTSITVLYKILYFLNCAKTSVYLL